MRNKSTNKRSSSVMKESARLLRWYGDHRRLLPWRESRDPYRVWVSEIMLQQTQVQTVIPYYEAFVQQFPTVELLAAADLDEVLAAWSGLGYYRRARQMHSAALVIGASGRGFPSTSQDLQSLPGVGPYTAAAVASIAFGEVVPVLDGNVERVMARRLAEDRDPKKASVRRLLLEAARQLLDTEQAGESNQALMELGATVCRPRRPACGECPLNRRCLAHQLRDPEAFPVPRRRRVVEHVDIAVATAVRGERILLFRRPLDSALMAGLWEFPNTLLSRSLEEMGGALESKYGGDWALERTGLMVKHGITHRSMKLHIHQALFRGGNSVGEGPEGAWVSRGEIPRFAVSSAVEKIVMQARLWG